MGEESVETRLSVHEAVCAARYEKINESLESGKSRMQKIEILIYIVIGTILLGPGVAAELIKKILGI